MSKRQEMAFEDCERMIVALREAVREAKAGRSEPAVAHARVGLTLLELWSSMERHGPYKERA